ncbi:helix-turn-helix domain-containing protein [Bacillus sp. FJAT-29790]|uniref:helix-turn-helix domain-containing protein n=1 Tax=Bacillus sp. FJAT-29790 TaxID=1895002 RepID=UPI001C21986B|nr:helix-turn-helix domain-containing protein [Bacillus sp. FJAT-29790]MBU8879153.1 helix-turn-helix domain-containing protein [Bacillus sp. FJAT-29790]
MDIVKSALFYLDKIIKNSPYQIWAGQQHEQKHIYSNGSNKSFSPPFFSLLKTVKTYTINSNNGMTFYFFFYPEEFHICLCIIKENLLLTDEMLEQLHYYFYPLYSQEMIQKRDHEWKVVMETTRSINSAINTDEVLSNIVRNAIKVIPAADAGYLQLYDKSSERLVLKAAVGFNEHINDFRPKSGESITGMTFLDGKTRIYHSRKEILDAMSEQKITEENYHHIISSIDDHLLTGGICVAVSIGEKRIGVMMVHQFFAKGSLTNRDIVLLQGFAAQAAIAIQNAKLFSEIKNNIAELTELSQQLTEKNAVLNKRNQVHKTLTQISLKNKGAKTIITELAQMVEIPICFYDCIEDEFLCCHQSQRHNFSYEEIRKKMLPNQAPHYVDIQGDENGCYYLYPINNGTAFLGCLIAAATNPLSKLDIVTIEQGGAILALELVKKHTLTDIYYKKTHEYFTALIKTTNPESLYKQGKDFGLLPSSYICAAVFEIKTYHDLQLLEANIHRLVSFIKKSFPTLQLLIYGFHNKVNLLISTDHPSAQVEMTEKLANLIRMWKNNGGQNLTVGIGSTYRGIENISKSYDEAEKALAYLANREESTIIHYENIGVNRLFIHQQPHEIERFLEETFAPLFAEKNHHELEHTLLTYIQMNKSAAETAKQLHIHINTLYKRLKRMEELLYIDFNNPEDNLKIQLACHLRASYNLNKF